MVKISVVIPVYNAEKYLKKCLDSILTQSLSDIEIICVDDGSSDDSFDILKLYAARDGRLQLISQKNSGPGSARNTGLSAANGKYVIFLDADDWFEYNFLEKMYMCSEKSCSDICICKSERFDSESGSALPSDWTLKTELIPGETFATEDAAKYLFQFTYGQVWDKLFLRSFLIENEILFPEFRNSEDTAFAYKALLSSRRLAVVPEVFVHYRVNVSGSVSASIIKQPEAPYEAFRLIHEHLELMSNKELYRQSFLNWAMEYLVWHVCNIPDKSIRKRYFYEVRNVWFPKLNFEQLDGHYYSKLNYCKFLVIKHLPHTMMVSILKLYKMLFRADPLF